MSLTRNCITNKYRYNEAGVHMKPINLLLLLIVLLLVSACGSNQNTLDRSGPRLVSVATLAPTASVDANSITATATSLPIVIVPTTTTSIVVQQQQLPVSTID